MSNSYPATVNSSVIRNFLSEFPAIQFPAFSSYSVSYKVSKSDYGHKKLENSKILWALFVLYWIEVQNAIKRTRSSCPWFVAFWQIFRFHMRWTAEIFRICLIKDFMKPLKIWVHSDNFYWYFFKGGFLSKNPKNQCILGFLDFSVFPLWKYENKSCLNELKFWEASGNPKPSKFWKLQLSISCGI